MTDDRGGLDHPFSIQRNALPGRWQELLNQPEVASYDTFRPVLEVSAAVDFRDIYTSLGYDPKRVKSAYADAPYPFGMNPLNPSTLKPEIWLAAMETEATTDVASLYTEWFDGMPDFLRRTTAPDQIKALVYQTINPAVTGNQAPLDRLKNVLEAKYAFDQGDKAPAAWLAYAEEEDAAKSIYRYYHLEAKKLAPGEMKQMDDMIYDDIFPNIFRRAKTFEVLRGLRRACGLSDVEIARRAQQFQSLTGKS